MKFFLLLIFFLSPFVNAKTTWIPIHSGKVFTVIPLIPKGVFEAPTGLKKQQLSSGIKVSWNDVEHASKFLIQAKNTSGDWIDIKIVEGTELILGNEFKQYHQVRISACNYISCKNTGLASSSLTFKKSIIFVHPDILGSPVAESTL
ncbi:hypothetical protein [Pseudoalteromonas sp. Of7M-16]|uniref:hypothetical protein n=1 Tax=Pseudoalteromonas sp. Of7M-16 TaxID=2917756 RepID=UPI001EF5CEE3|nr:hypothetical protein [Pseudoalteromonas sp. Of7M-16]MCG7548664.1 hypothetical protein [Pseudoalteromonas sp. Of7M-16]